MNASSAGQGQDGLFKAVLETVSDGVTVIDRELRIQYQNKIIMHLFGPRIGRHCYEAYRGRKTPCEDCMVIEVLRDGRERRGIRDVPLPGGGVSLVEISSAAVRDENGIIIGAVEVARDVTVQKRAEALLNKTLLERNAVLNKLNSELSDAAGYVKTVLPQKMKSEDLQTDWRFIPSAALGGDSFGYHWIDTEHFAVYLIDVSGHGWAAALLSVSVMNVLRAHALRAADFRKPETVLFALNNAFPSERHNDMFFSIWYGVYRKSARRLDYASAGHPPAVLFPPASPDPAPMELLRTPNVVIGGEKDTHFQSRHREIPPAARLLIFSDGVFDITRADGSIWGFNRFLDFLAQAARPGAPILDGLLNAAQDLSRHKPFEDDFTCLEVVFA